MYSRTLKECENILKKHGINTTPFLLRPGRSLLSYTYCNHLIYLGLLIRLKQFIVGVGARHTIIHEIAHNLFVEFPPSRKIRRVFGAAREWRKRQNFWNFLNPRLRGKYVSRYARTHPEEDLVETATLILEGQKLKGAKGEAIRKWFKQIKEQNS